MSEACTKRSGRVRRTAVKVLAAPRAPHEFLDTLSRSLKPRHWLRLLLRRLAWVDFPDAQRMVAALRQTEHAVAEGEPAGAPNGRRSQDTADGLSGIVEAPCL